MSTDITNTSTNFPDTEDRIFDTRDVRTKGRLIALFLIGLILLFYAIQQIITIWTPRSSLILLEGTMENCDLYITPVNAPDRYDNDHFTQKAELVFYLREHKKKFALTKNIGSDYSDEQYSDIKNRLTHSNTIIVSIKKSEVDYWEPQVFTIDTDRGAVLDFDNVRFKDRPVTLFMLILGLGCLIFPVYCFIPTYLQVSKRKSRLSINPVGT